MGNYKKEDGRMDRIRGSVMFLETMLVREVCDKKFVIKKYLSADCYN